MSGNARFLYLDYYCLDGKKIDLKHNQSLFSGSCMRKQNSNNRFYQSTLFKIMVAQLIIIGICALVFTIGFKWRLESRYQEYRQNAEFAYFINTAELFRQNLAKTRIDAKEIALHYRRAKSCFSEKEAQKNVIQTAGGGQIFFLTKEEVEIYKSEEWVHDESFSGLRLLFPISETDSNEGFVLVQRTLSDILPVFRKEQTGVDSVQIIFADSKGHIINSRGIKADFYNSVLTKRVLAEKENQGSFKDTNIFSETISVYYSKTSDYLMFMTTRDLTMSIQSSEIFSLIFLIVSVMFACSVFSMFYLFRNMIAPLSRMNQSLTKIIENDWNGEFKSASHFKELQNLFDFLNSLLQKFREQREAQKEHWLYLEQEIQKRTVELERINNHLKSMSDIDDLTGLPNRKNITCALRSEINRSKRFQKDFTILLLDADSFRKLNESFGYPAGDFVLREMSQVFKKALREYDYIARYDSEKFLLMLPQTDRLTALPVAERFRKLIGEYKFEYKEHSISLTVSVGIAVYDKNYNLEENLERAEQALMESKKSGGNCTSVYKEKAV